MRYARFGVLLSSTVGAAPGLLYAAILGVCSRIGSDERVRERARESECVPGSNLKDATCEKLPHASRRSSREVSADAASRHVSSMLCDSSMMTADRVQREAAVRADEHYGCE